MGHANVFTSYVLKDFFRGETLVDEKRGKTGRPNFHFRVGVDTHPPLIILYSYGEKLVSQLL